MDELDAGQDLPTLFASALELYKELHERYDVSKFESSLSLWNACRDRISTLGLFSSNETVEDLSTNSIKYLSVEYYMGRTLESYQSQDLGLRMAYLEQSLATLKLFVENTTAYGLLWQSTLSLCQHAQDQGGQKKDLMASRELKIAKHHAIKSLNEQYLECGILLGVEEAARERQMISVQTQAIEADSEMENILAELSLLKQRGGPAKDLLTPSRSPHPARVSRVTQPFTLIKDRRQLAKAVFGPGHNLPTMTIDEYLTLERRRGGILDGPSGAATVAKGGSDPEYDHDEEALERQRRKDTSFDAFKDDNPRGWGNTYNLS